MIYMKAGARQLLFLTAVLCIAHVSRADQYDDFCYPDTSGNYAAVRGLGIRLAQALTRVDAPNAIDEGGYSPSTGVKVVTYPETCSNITGLEALNDAFLSIYNVSDAYDDPSVYDLAGDGLTGTWTYDDLVDCANADANASYEYSQCWESLQTLDAYKSCTPACRVWYNATRVPCTISVTATKGQYLLNVLDTYCGGSDTSPYTCSTNESPSPLASTPSSAPLPGVSPGGYDLLGPPQYVYYGLYDACFFVMDFFDVWDSWGAKMSLCDASLQDPGAVPGTCTAACKRFWTSTPNVCVGIWVALMGQEVASTLDSYCGCCGSSYVDDTSGWSSAPDPIASGPAPYLSLSRKLKM